MTLMQSALFHGPNKVMDKEKLLADSGEKQSSWKDRFVQNDNESNNDWSCISSSELNVASPFDDIGFLSMDPTGLHTSCPDNNNSRANGFRLTKRDKQLSIRKSKKRNGGTTSSIANAVLEASTPDAITTVSSPKRLTTVASSCSSSDGGDVANYGVNYDDVVGAEDDDDDEMDGTTSLATCTTSRPLESYPPAPALDDFLHSSTAATTTTTASNPNNPNADQPPQYSTAVTPPSSPGKFKKFKKPFKKFKRRGSLGVIPKKRSPSSERDSSNDGAESTNGYSAAGASSGLSTAGDVSLTLSKAIEQGPPASVDDCANGSSANVSSFTHTTTTHNDSTDVSTKQRPQRRRSKKLSALFSSSSSSGNNGSGLSTKQQQKQQIEFLQQQARQREVEYLQSLQALQQENNKLQAYLQEETDRATKYQNLAKWLGIEELVITTYDMEFYRHRYDHARLEFQWAKKGWDDARVVIQKKETHVSQLEDKIAKQEQRIRSLEDQLDMAHAAATAYDSTDSISLVSGKNNINTDSKTNNNNNKNKNDKEAGSGGTSPPNAAIPSSGSQHSLQSFMLSPPAKRKVNNVNRNGVANAANRNGDDYVSDRYCYGGDDDDAYSFADESAVSYQYGNLMPDSQKSPAPNAMPTPNSNSNNPKLSSHLENSVSMLVQHLEEIEEEMSKDASELSRLSGEKKRQELQQKRRRSSTASFQQVIQEDGNMLLQGEHENDNDEENEDIHSLILVGGNDKKDSAILLDQKKEINTSAGDGSNDENNNDKKLDGNVAEKGVKNSVAEHDPRSSSNNNNDTTSNMVESEVAPTQSPVAKNSSGMVHRGQRQGVALEKYMDSLGSSKAQLQHDPTGEDLETATWAQLSVNKSDGFSPVPDKPQPASTRRLSAVIPLQKGQQQMSKQSAHRLPGRSASDAPDKSTTDSSGALNARGLRRVSSNPSKQPSSIKSLRGEELNYDYTSEAPHSPGALSSSRFRRRLSNGSKNSMARTYHGNEDPYYYGEAPHSPGVLSASRPRKVSSKNSMARSFHGFEELYYDIDAAHSPGVLASAPKLHRTTSSESKNSVTRSNTGDDNDNNNPLSSASAARKTPGTVVSKSKHSKKSRNRSSSFDNLGSAHDGPSRSNTSNKTSKSALRRSNHSKDATPDNSDDTSLAGGSGGVGDGEDVRSRRLTRRTRRRSSSRSRSRSSSKSRKSKDRSSHGIGGISSSGHGKSGMGGSSSHHSTRRANRRSSHGPNASDDPLDTASTHSAGRNSQRKAMILSRMDDFIDQRGGDINNNMSKSTHHVTNKSNNSTHKKPSRSKSDEDLVVVQQSLNKTEPARIRPKTKKQSSSKRKTDRYY